MNLKQLINRFRRDALDLLDPPMCSDADIIDWLNEAEREAAIRARLLLEDANPGLCSIKVDAGTSSYRLHPKVYEIVHQAFIPDATHTPCGLDIVTREKLDRVRPQWRELPADDPRWLIQTDTAVRLVPVPFQDGVLRIEAYRLPMKDMCSPIDEPEIHEAHHIKLVQWALFKAFSTPDSDLFDAARSQAAYLAFEGYFGVRPDVDLRRSTRGDEVQTTVVQTF